MHATLYAAAGLTAFLLRFEFQLPAEYVPHAIAGIGIWVTVKLALLHLESMDRGWARFLSATDVAHIIRVNGKASIASAVLIVLLGPPGFPRSLYFIDFALAVLATTGVRLAGRRWRDRASFSRGDKSQRTLLYGAGAAAEVLLQEIHSNPRVPFDVVGFIDDNPARSGMVIHGKRVFGTGRTLAEVVRDQQVVRVLIAMPSATGPELAEVLERCHEAGVACRTVPALDEILVERRERFSTPSQGEAQPL